MDTYIYQADIYCKDCGEAILRKLENDGQYAHLIPANPRDESSYDSDDYPKGPYPNGGGEADTPQHCGLCSVLLENPLTSDGEKYVLDAVNSISDREAAFERFREWVMFYSYLFPEQEAAQ